MIAPLPPLRVTSLHQPAAEHGNNGVNKPIKARTADGRTVVYKHNSRSRLGPLAKVIPPDHAHWEDIREIVGSHIMSDHFGLPGVTYQQAYLQAPDGRLQLGTCCEFVPSLRTLEHHQASIIHNPDQAVAQNIVKGWMGDWDTILNDSNVWVNGSGTALAADYGNAFKDGVTLLGIPKANEKVMRAFATPARVDPIVNRIRGMSDDDIRAVVDKTGARWVGDWDETKAERLSTVLIQNRDRLRQHNPFAHYYHGFHPELKASMRNLMWLPVHAIPTLGVAGHVLAVTLREVRDTLNPWPQPQD